MQSTLGVHSPHDVLNMKITRVTTNQIDLYFHVMSYATGSSCTHEDIKRTNAYGRHFVTYLGDEAFLAILLTFYVIIDQDGDVVCVIIEITFV